MQGRYYKEIQRVIDTINDGTLYLRGPVCIVYFVTQKRAPACKLVDCTSADHGVAFPCRSLEYRG